MSRNGNFKHSVQRGEEKKGGWDQAQWLFTPEAGPNATRSLAHGSFHLARLSMPRPPSIRVNVKEWSKI